MRWTTRLKQFIYPLYIVAKAGPFQKRRVKHLFRYYRAQAKAGIPTHHDQQPLKLFSSLDEDGIILRIIATLGIECGYFIDIGANDCINSNCALPALVFGWEGLFIDSDAKQLAIGKKNYRRFGKLKNNRLQFACSHVTPANINHIITAHAGNREVDLVSIDIDGNDYAILEAISIRPKLIVAENKVEYGQHDIAITEANGAAFHRSQWGASPYTMTKLARQKGYTLVAANIDGFNTFYLRNDLVSPLLPPLEVDALLSRPQVSKDLYPENIMAALRQKLARPSFH